MNEQYGSCTWRLVFCWFVAMFIYYGILLLLPSILQELFASAKNYNFKYFFIFMVTAVEVGFYKFNQLLMDNPRIGRKKCVFYGAISSFILFILVMLIGVSYPSLLLIIFILVRLGIILMFLVII